MRDHKGCIERVGFGRDTHLLQYPRKLFSDAHGEAAKT